MKYCVFKFLIKIKYIEINLFILIYFKVIDNKTNINNDFRNLLKIKN